MPIERPDVTLIPRGSEDSMTANAYPAISTYQGEYSDWYRYGHGDGYDEDTVPSPIAPILFRSIRRRKWLVLITAVLVTVLVAFFVYRIRPTFTASTMVEIGQESLKSLGPTQVDPENSVNINTKILMFSARPLLEDVVVKLELNHNQDFLNLSSSRPLSEMVDMVLHRRVQENRPAISPTRPLALPPLTEPGQADPKRDASGLYIEDPKLDRFVSILEGGLKVDHIQNTQALKISFTHPNPVIAATVANGLAEVFIQRNHQSKIDRFTTTSDWLDRSTQELKAKVQRAEQSLADYNRDHDIYTTQGTNSLTSDKLLRLHQEALRAEMDLQVKRSVYDEVVRGHVGDLPEAFSDPRTIELQKQINQLSVTAAQLSVSYGPDNPHLQEVQQQINKLQEQVGSGRKELAAKIKSDYQRAEADYKFAAAALEQAKSEAAQQDQASIQYNILKQDADTARSLYNEFLQKTNQANLEEAQQQQNNIDIIRPARIPKAPDGPPKSVILLLGPVLGVLAGIGIAFAREQVDRSVKTSEDVARFAQLPMLGAIPSIRAAKTRFLGKGGKKGRKAPRPLGLQAGNGNPDANPESRSSSYRFLPYPSGSSTLSSASEIAVLNQLQP